MIFCDIKIQQNVTLYIQENQSSAAAGCSKSIQLSSVSADTGNHNQLILQPQQPTTGNLSVSMLISRILYMEESKGKVCYIGHIASTKNASGVLYKLYYCQYI